MFDGKTLDGWHLRDPKGSNCWTAENGELVCTPQPRGSDLATNEAFRDFELGLEFLLEKGANSGVFLRGLYEVQLHDDNSEPGAAQGTLWRDLEQIAPSKKAYLGPERWNTLHVQLTGQHVTVAMNGERIIDNACVTTGSPKVKDGDPGPIGLQCHSPSPGPTKRPSWAAGGTRFRNICIRSTSGRQTAGGGRVDDAFINEVAALPAKQQIARVIARLKELNPGFDPVAAGERDKIENGAVTELSFKTERVADIAPVRALTGLRFLNFDSDFEKSKLQDLSPLRGLRLTSFSARMTKVSDLSPLAGMPLTSLGCAWTEVADLSPLKGMPLDRLWCYATQVRDLSPLAGLKLKMLYCSRVKDLTPLRGMPLDDLNVDCRGADLTPLVGMPLRLLKCNFDPRRDTEILRSIKTLEKINGLPVAEFWKQVQAGKVPPPK